MTFASTEFSASAEDAFAREVRLIREREQRRAAARAERVLRYRSLLRPLSLAELEWFEADLPEGASVVSAGLDSQRNPITIQGALSGALAAALNEKR
jgi:hypothetical protein